MTGQHPHGASPVEGALDGLLPARIQPLARLGRHRRLELAIERPVVRHVVRADPVAHRQARQVRGTERGRLRNDGTPDRHAEEVGLELQQGVVGGGAAVHLAAPTAAAPASALHQRRARRASGRPSSPRSPARCGRSSVSRVRPMMSPRAYGIPVRRAEADERRHEVDAAGVRHGRRQPLDFGRAPNRLQAVAHPLHRGAGDEDGALRARRSSCRRSVQPIVVSRPFCDGTGVRPVLSSMKQPVPYVFFARPARSTPGRRAPPADRRRRRRSASARPRAPASVSP